tara:strand:- start:2577 stop:4055 length:1479 start_codon:yes stop_codon:yes gene_type:complete
VIKLKNILTEAYGTYVKNAQNKSLKRVGKKYGSTGKTSSPKVKIPKFELPKSSPAHPDYKNWKAKQDVKEKQIQAKYKNIDRKPNIQNGIDVVKSGKDLEHFLNDFNNKADTVDSIDHGDFVRDQFDKNKAALPQAQQRELEGDIESWKRMGGYEAIKRAQSPRILQFIKGRNRRISDISHKTVTKVKQPIERGIMIPNKDVDKFLERFKLGEMVDIPDEGSHGSSGFSISGKTARSFSGYEYTDEGAMADDASIIMRISPNKNGELRGLFVDGQEQSDGGGYWSEGEITRSSKSRAKCVSIKKVRYPSGKMVYVIDMQEPDDLTTESLQYEATETSDSLSRKYLEGPLNPKPRKSVKEGMIKLKDLLLERFNKQAVVDRVYPQIVKNLGRARRGTPKVEFHSNIYVRITGIEGMQGEANPHAEYDWENNKIYLYTPRMVNEEEIIKGILHEYTHATQDPKKMEKYQQELGYKNNPYEKAAHRAERNWRKYI